MDSFKKKNKQGQVAFISVMLGVVLIILGLALAPALKDVISGDDVMGEDGLNCSSTNITNQDKAVCTSTDSMIPTYVMVIFGLAFLLFGRIVL